MIKMNKVKWLDILFLLLAFIPSMIIYRVVASSNNYVSIRNQKLVEKKNDSIIQQNSKLLGGSDGGNLKNTVIHALDGGLNDADDRRHVFLNQRTLIGADWLVGNSDMAFEYVNAGGGGSVNDLRVVTQNSDYFLMTFKYNLTDVNGNGDTVVKTNQVVISGKRSEGGQFITSYINGTQPY